MSAWDNYWCVSYTPRSLLTGRAELTEQELAASRPMALLRARVLSRQHGHATVTNRAGLVATFVNGEEWTSPTPAPPVPDTG